MKLILDKNKCKKNTNKDDIDIRVLENVWNE
jgi:hypothetical protein